MSKKALVVGMLVGGLVLGSVGMGFAYPGKWNGSPWGMHNSHYAMVGMWRGNTDIVDTGVLAKALSISVQDVKNYLVKLNGNPMRLINAKAIANVSGKTLKGVVDNLTKYDAYYYAVNILRLDISKVYAERIKLLSVIRDRMWISGSRSGFGRWGNRSMVRSGRWVNNVGVTNIDILAKGLSINVQEARNYLSQLYGNPRMLITAKAVANLSHRDMNEVVNGFKKYRPYYYIAEVLKLDPVKVRQEVIRLSVNLK